MSKLSIAALALFLGCAQPDGDVGRVCAVSADRVVTGVTIEVPTLDCETRMCLAFGEGGGAVRTVKGSCTQLCDADDECPAEPDTDCRSGYVCATPTTVGTFCCKKMCVCADDLARLPASQPVPGACDPDNPANTCANLEGR